MLKLNAIDKARLAYRRAFAKENLASITYNKKSNGQTESFLIDMNFIEDLGERFNTYAFATSTHSGGIRSFYKNRIQKFKLV